MNRGRKCGGFKFKENRVGFYGVSVLVLGDISDNAARRNCDCLLGITGILFSVFPAYRLLLLCINDLCING